MTLLQGDALDPLTRPPTGWPRLLVALLQGAALYWLYRSGADALWPATVPVLFTPLVLLLVFAPVLLILSLGHLAPRRTALWVGGAALLLAALGCYDAWRVAMAAAPQVLVRTPSAQLVIHLVVALFIGHTLVTAANAERRPIASYGGYFDGAWKLAVQLVFSAGFVGASWLVLALGSALFKLIGLDFLDRLLGKAWFSIPVTTFAFACAIHITDVRPAIVRGIRGLILVLLSWLLPVVTLLVGGFLLSMPFTGLAPLWATRHAAATLLGAAAVLVIMINTAWQNGAALAAAAAPLRWSARAAAVLLTPLVLIAALALRLRVAEYGWTDDRVVACACLLVAACYALGYLAAALRSPLLAGIGSVNIGTAFVVVAVTLALFSPLLDPARVSVNSQLARLAAGKVAADKFDYNYLRFGGRRYGAEALRALQGQAGGAQASVVRARATAALALEWPGQPAPVLAPLPTDTLQANLTVWPAGATLPAGLLSHLRLTPAMWPAPRCLSEQKVHCDVFLVDLQGSAKPDVLVLDDLDQHGPGVVLHEGTDGNWTIVEALPFGITRCPGLRNRLKAGQYHTVPAPRKVLEVGGQVVQMQAVGAVGETHCPP